jgi:DNA/RNA non-specific endonuclease
MNRQGSVFKVVGFPRFARAQLVMAALAGVLLAGCGGFDLDVGGDGAASRMERDFGGPDGLLDFFERNDDENIARAMANYGVEFRSHALISDCPKYFPSGDRNVWHHFNGEYYFIEASGRPHRAYAYLPPIASEPRSDSCQLNVGQWGDQENPSNDYDGGHMIGSQLGGWGKRANLIPQDANFNRGNWVVLENKMAKCRVLPNGRMRYYIGANYPNGSALIPNNLTMQITNQVSGANVSMSFANTDGGGSNGTSEKNRGVSFLTNQGCN